MSRGRPNVLLILTDQLRYPPPYESEELRQYRHEHCVGQERLRQNGVSFKYHYPIAAACAPSRASLLTGHYPSLHGVTQTDGLAKDATNSDEMFWLAPDAVPTLGEWFRAGGYRTYFKGKWHASHARLDAEDGDGFLLSIDDDGNPQQENIEKYLKADLLDDYGFSEWVGPEPHGLGAHNTGTVKDPFTVDETIALLERFDGEDSEEPWLTVCFLNPHDDSLFGVIALSQGLRYHPSEVPHVEQSPTHEEDLSTKPSCQQSYVDTWGKIIAPQPWIETHLKFYYQMQAAVGEQITRVLDALQASEAYENTIVIFSSDHGDLQGSHGGMHEKWHCAYDEALRVPFIVSSPLLPGGERELEIPTNHADLIPTLLGLAGVDHDQALAKLKVDHVDAHPAGRARSLAIRSAEPVAPSEPILFTTDDEVSEGSMPPASPFQRFARVLRVYTTVKQPNHLETAIAEVAVDGEPHLVKFSRYYDNPQFWTVPGERDERLHGRHTTTVTEPEPEEYELYDLTLDPTEVRNLAHPSLADDHSRALQQTMLGLLIEQLAAKRMTPSAGGRPGYRPPATA